jgi:hypothetical protein
LLAQNKKKDRNEVSTWYPFIRQGERIELRLKRIQEWSNGHEAVLTGETRDGIEIGFFDTKYHKNKTLYRLGEVYPFSIAALSYSVDVVSERRIIMKGRDAVDFYKRTGQRPHIGLDGKVAPLEFDISDIVQMQSFDADRRADVVVQSPVYAIDDLTVFNRPFYRLRIMIHRSPDISINLYANPTMFSNRPALRDPVRGVIWLQGYLVEPEDELLKPMEDAVIVDELGVPCVVKHECEADRAGQVMTVEERHKFAVEFLADLYRDMELTVVDVNRRCDREFPNIVMKNDEGKLYYITVASTFGESETGLMSSFDFTSVKQYAKEAGATLAYAEIMLKNADESITEPLCGGGYHIVYKGLRAIR